MEQPTPRSAVTAPSDSPRPDAVRRVHFWTDPLPCAETDAAGLLGGKAASLGMLSRAGLSVPPAFTVTIEACRQYHALGRKWPAGLWQEIRNALNRLEGATGRRLGYPPRPLTLAIRSGAAESMPGLLATFLHCGLSEPLVRQIDDERTWEEFAEFLDGYAPVHLRRVCPDQPVTVGSDMTSARQKCERWLACLAGTSGGPLPSDPESLLQQAITAVFDSWENEAVRRFCALADWTSAEGTSVTVQAMFVAEVSGVVFSGYPEQLNNDDLVVEAMHGLGRRLVGGQVTPVRWVVDRQTLSIRDRNASEPSQDEMHFREFIHRGLLPLCRAALQTESVFGVPVDMEFGYAAGELAYFQARPVTKTTTSIWERVCLEERTHLLNEAKRGRRLWVRHNLSETLPAPTPLTWDVWRHFMTGEGGYGRLYRRLGYRPSALVRREGFLALIAGRIYADPDRLVQMFCTGYPLRFDQGALRRNPEVLNSAPTRMDLVQLDPWFLLRWPLVAMTMIRSGLRQRSFANRAVTDFEQYVRPRLQEWAVQERKRDLGPLTLVELIAVFDLRRRCVLDEFAPETLLPGTLGSVAWSALEKQLLSILGDIEGRALANELLGWIADPTLDQQRNLLQQLNSGDQMMAVFLQEFGHRGPNELDLSSPRWRERPNSVHAAARRLTPSPPAALENIERSSLDHHLRAALERTGAGCLHHELSDLLHQAVTLLPYREIGKHEWLRVYELLRDVVTEISQRTGLGDGIHFLTIAELHQLATETELKRVIVERRQHYRACRKLFVPAVIDADDDLAGFGLLPPSTLQGRTLPATSLSSGQATGRVFLIREDERTFDLASDAVVVASTIDPGCLPFLADALALVVEQGGMLSHVALLARQFGIPAVVADQITNIVVAGEAIRIDADHGLIELTDRIP